MADVAKPAANGAAAPKQQITRPEKPDEEKYAEEVSKLEKAHTAAEEKAKAAKAKVDLARGGGPNKDSPNAKRQAELKAELGQIRQTQQGNKSSRTAIFERIKKLDEQLKSRTNELKQAKSKVNYKSVEDVDREISHLQKQVDTGTMKLVDEKKALTEISNLNKLRKGFSGFEAQQKAIDDVKAQIAEQKKLLDDPEQKALSDKYTKLQTELDGLKKEQDDAYKNLNNLRDAYTKARNEAQEKYAALKAFKDAHFAQKRAYREYEAKARQARFEKRRQEQLEWQNAKKKEAAAKRLEEASAPAYQDEILTAEGLIRFFDPSALPTKETTAASKFAASAQRTVDDSAFKGARVVKKDDEESYFIGGAGKKKKGKKSGASAPAEKFQLNIGVLEELSKVGVDAPSSQADVPAVVEKLKAKLAHWKEDQDRKTKENIAKAQKEIDRLEAEESDEGAKDTARKPAEKNQGVNGEPVSAEAELQQEQDAVKDAAEDLAKATIEDKATDEAAATEIAQES